MFRSPPAPLALAGAPTLHTPDWHPAKYTRAPKPTGGFALLPLEALLLSWLAHEQDIITPLALRGYLACLELRERRCQATPDTAIHYTTEELRRLLGAAVRPSAAAAVRQTLCATGLVAWAEDGHQLMLCPQGTAVPWIDLPRYTALRAAIHPSVQQVPLPRRLLTRLAQEGAPGLIATVFGVACRALRYHDHHVIAGGSLLPTWVAATFQIARRTVAHWLHHLRVLHWIAPIATSPAHRHAYGPWIAVNLQWPPRTPAGTAATPTLASAPAGWHHRARAGTQGVHASEGPAPQSRALARTAQTTRGPRRPPGHETPPGPPHGTLTPKAEAVGGGETAAQDAHTVDPAAAYAALPPAGQATLYQEAEARLLQAHPRAFVIRPVVLAEVYHGLATRRLAAPAPLDPAARAAIPPTDKNLANPVLPDSKNLASPRKNLATPPPTACLCPPDIPKSSATMPVLDGNPFQETDPFRPHKNLALQANPGVCIRPQEPPSRSSAPAAPPVPLPPVAQTTLYQEADARRRQPYAPALPPPQAPPPPAVAPALPPAHTATASASTTAGALSRSAPSTPGAEPPRTPQRLDAITPADLTDVPCLQRLWQQAQTRGWVGGSAADWRTVVAAAQHALRVGRNPGGLFVAVLRQHAWHLITQTDEDTAQQVLKAAQGPLTSGERRVLHRLFGREVAEPPAPQVPPLSLEAQCAREALRLCQTARWAGDPFTVVKAAEPAWTRARWEAARAELEQWQLLQQVANAQQQRAQVHAAVCDVDEATEAAGAENEHGHID